MVKKLLVVLTTIWHGCVHCLHNLCYNAILDSWEVGFIYTVIKHLIHIKGCYRALGVSWKDSRAKAAHLEAGFVSLKPQMGLSYQGWVSLKSHLALHVNFTLNYSNLQTIGCKKTEENTVCENELGALHSILICNMHRLLHVNNFRFWP